MRYPTDKEIQAGMESARRWDAAQAAKAHQKKLGLVLGVTVRQAAREALLDAFWPKVERGD